MARETNPAGSTNSFRGDVLRVLGVLKVATADQIQRIGAPHLNHRHTGKKTPSERKQARTASHTGALSDLRKHHLAENGGSTTTGETLRNLTTKGLEAASYELRRPVSEMGSTARGAGSSGASHPMSVNETVIALLRPKPDLGKLADDPPHVQAAARAAVDTPPGIGTIASYWTEVPLPATGTWNAPGKGGAQADLVLTAPQDGAGLLFIEVDNCHETAEELAAKLEKYARFFRRRVKDTDGRERPMWRTRWTVPADRYGETPHPAVLLVFNHIGERNPNRTVPRLMELTPHFWKGQWQREDYHLYDGKIPIIAVGLKNLREHGPTGPVFFRFGRDRPSRSWKRSATPAARRPMPARQRQPGPVRRSTRHSRMPFTDERWKAVNRTGWGPVRMEPRPTLCGDCDQQYVTDIQQAWPGTTHQEPEQDQEQTLPEQKAGGTWLSRFRR
ncbi:replication-relaxation family protein [Streptomyces sp. NPDC052164]|uniref:replication-relaxation family protein n=1 Tax=Streptomyces sp. NPDC052164 TaxID=3155529 RepID=UPI0034343879